MEKANKALQKKVTQLQNKLQQDLDLTPPNLDIAKDLDISIKELDELQNLYKKVKIPELKVPDLKSKAKDLLSKSDLSGLTDKAEDLQKLVSDYKNNFKSWDEKLLAKAMDIEDLKLLKEQQEKLAAYKPFPEGYRENMEGFQSSTIL
ncbi:hypothetical protein [Roseivirga seohaensis]|uniref:hypothetical protein n=1 Tax=Roseivirga seohaensis TaxID=1914963 RepID=UPI003BA92F57